MAATRKKQPARPKSPASAHSSFTDLNQLPIAIDLGGHQATIQYWGYFEPQYWRNYLHTHSFFEICYAYQGRGTFRMLGNDYPVGKGDLFIAKPGEEHEIISSRQDPIGIYYWAFSLQRGRVSIAAGSPVDELLDRFARSSRWVISGAPEVLTTLKLLTQEIANRSAGYPLVVDGLVTKLLVETCRAVVVESVSAEAVYPPARSEAHGLVETAIRYIRDNLGRPISLRDVAAQVHVSERHLSRLFHQVRQTTVLDCITHARIENATQLLLKEQWAVKKIAAASGYPDVRYFTTLFRKRMKMTPAVFRSLGGTAFADESRRGKGR